MKALVFQNNFNFMLSSRPPAGASKQA